MVRGALAILKRNTIPAALVASGMALFAPVWAETTLLWDPPAIKVHPDMASSLNNQMAGPELVRDGEVLFQTIFNILDGAGRPEATGDSKPTPRLPDRGSLTNRIAGPDAGSCHSCHNQPALGGAGDFVTNTFVGAHLTDPPIDSVAPELTNERNTTPLFGAGAVEMVAREMTTELIALRDSAVARAQESAQSQTVNLTTKGVSFGLLTVRADGTLDMSGVEGIDYDLVVKPFGSKGVAVSLREFTLFALNQHHGMQAIERYGWQRTGSHDFDGDGIEREISLGQATALTLFQVSLPARDQTFSEDPSRRTHEENGAALFEQAGCASCHVPSLEISSELFSEPNPYNRPGALLPEHLGGTISLPLPIGTDGNGITQTEEGRIVIRLYSDLKRHVICDQEVAVLCNERIRQDGVPTDMFMTPRLWDVAVTAPYCHHGRCSTLSEAILAHGGEARNARENFLRLSDQDKRDIIAFLQSLGRGADH